VNRKVKPFPQTRVKYRRERVARGRRALCNDKQVQKRGVSAGKKNGTARVPKGKSKKEEWESSAAPMTWPEGQGRREGKGVGGMEKSKRAKREAP